MFALPFFGYSQTLYTQNLSQFDLHLRAILDLPIPNVKILRNGCTSVIKTKSKEENAFEYILSQKMKRRVLRKLQRGVTANLFNFPCHCPK